MMNFVFILLFLLTLGVSSQTKAEQLPCGNSGQICCDGSCSPGLSCDSWNICTIPIGIPIDPPPFPGGPNPSTEPPHWIDPPPIPPIIPNWPTTSTAPPPIIPPPGPVPGPGPSAGCAPFQPCIYRSSGPNTCDLYDHCSFCGTDNFCH